DDHRLGDRDRHPDGCDLSGEAQLVRGLRRPFLCGVGAFGAGLLGGDAGAHLAVAMVGVRAATRQTDRIVQRSGWKPTPIRPGLGQYIFASLLQKDFYVAQTLVMYTATAVVLLNLLVDVTYAVIDPRIRYA